MSGVSVCDIYISLSNRWPKPTILLFSSQQATSHSSPGAAAGGCVCVFVCVCVCGCVLLCFCVCGCVLLCFCVCVRVCISVCVCLQGPSSISQAVGRTPCGLGHMPDSDASCLKWLWVCLFAYVCWSTQLCVCVWVCVFISVCLQPHEKTYLHPSPQNSDVCSVI